MSSESPEAQSRRWSVRKVHVSAVKSRLLRVIVGAFRKAEKGAGKSYALGEGVVQSWEDGVASPSSIVSCLEGKRE